MKTKLKSILSKKYDKYITTNNYSVQYLADSEMSFMSLLEAMNKLNTLSTNDWYSDSLWTAATCTENNKYSTCRSTDAPCLSVVSFNSTIYVEHNLLLLVTSASDLPLHTNKFCSVLFSSAYSLMRGGRHRNCAILLHRQRSIVDCTNSSSHRSIASHLSRIAICAYPTPLRVPVGILPSCLVWKN